MAVRWAVAIVVSAAMLVVLIPLGRSLKKKFLPDRCVRCGKRALRVVSEVPLCGGNGRIGLSYHKCHACFAKLRLRDGSWSDAPADEWARMNPPK